MSLLAMPLCTEKAWPTKFLISMLINLKGVVLKRKFLSLIVIGATLTTVGCATRPESISASYVSHEKYIGQTCAELTDRMADARSQLAKFSEMQNSKANLDAATVFLVLIPASKLSGDSAADVAKYKGEVEAIETAQIKTGCKKLNS